MAHDPGSIMLYIHPPIAIIGHLLVFASLYPSFGGSRGRLARAIPFAAWIFVLAGLVSGMIWAQLAWGAYWSWDPKETAALVLFACVSANAYIYYGGLRRLKSRGNALRVLSVINCLLVALALLATWFPGGLHSYA